MSKDNFYCKECGKTKFLSRHKTKVHTDGKLKNVDEYGGLIICECGQEMFHIPKDGVPMFAKVNSMNIEDKRKILKKRSSEHFNKEIKEKQHYMHEDMKNQLLGK